MVKIRFDLTIGVIGDVEKFGLFRHYQASKSSFSSVIRAECFMRSMGLSALNRSNSSAGDSDVGAIVGSGDGLGGSTAIGSGTDWDRLTCAGTDSMLTVGTVSIVRVQSCV